MEVDDGILKRGDLAAFREGDPERKIVFTNGCFDLLHRGHVTILAAAREMGDCLVVGLNSDDSVRRLKGDSRPLVGELDRAFVLLALESVDYVTIFEEDTPLEAITALRPDVLVKGSEYGKGEIVGEQFVLGSGGRVERIRMVGGFSTSSLIGRIRGKL